MIFQCITSCITFFLNKYLYTRKLKSNTDTLNFTFLIYQQTFMYNFTDKLLIHCQYMLYLLLYFHYQFINRHLRTYWSL